MKNFNRVLSLVLVAVLVLGLVAGALVIVVSAAQTHSLVTLLEEGKIKPLGRTKVNKAGTGITADWSANGFEINVNADGGDFAVGYSSNQSGTYAAILVDGKQVWRGLATGEGTIKTTLTKGSHTVQVIRENGHSSSATQQFYFKNITFSGTIGAKSANKKLYVEVIGDSYSCGAGSAAAYAPGVLWGDADHSAQASFGWYLAEMLNADLSIVGRGGIGLFDGTSQEEGYQNVLTMLDIYENASGHNYDEGAYDFARKPDLVVIELGANDTIVSSDQYKTITAWAAKLQEMVDLVREKNGPDTKILMLSHVAAKYNQMLKIADADENAWACHFAHHGNGSAAKTTQEEGHPDAADEKQIAEALYKTIKDYDILPSKTLPTQKYTDITYYVSENGDDSKDGKTLATAMKTLKAVFDKAIADNGNSYVFPATTRLVIKVGGTVMNNAAASQVIDGGQVLLKAGGTSRDHIPVLITTNEDSGTKARIQVNYAPVDDGNGSVRVVNDLYFKDIELYSATSSAGFCSHSLYASGCALTFDNASLLTDGKGSTTGDDNTKWHVYADWFATGGFNPFKEDFLPLYGSVTFKNGDYTNLKQVAAVAASGLRDSNNVVQTALPQTHCSVIIEDGATMGTVYGARGTIGVDSVTVELRGGHVNAYYPTANGTSSAARVYNTDIKTVFDGGTIGNTAYYGTGNYVTITGNVTTEFKTGRYVGQIFAGTGSNVTITGNVNNIVSGGEIRVNPQSTGTGVDGIYLGGYKNVNITGDVINTISGGNLNLIYNANVDSGIYLGLRSGKITGNLTNNISGGNLCAMDGDAAAKSKGVYLGMYGGDITGTLTNKVTGGIFTGGNFGDRTVHNFIGKIVNEIGIEGSTQGPRFSADVNLGGGWAFVGQKLGTNGKVTPTAEHNSDTVVIKNTIYSGSFSNPVYGGSAGLYTQGTYWSYQIGSTQTDIYGGKFRGGFYGTGQSTVCGHVTTNIYGGYFTNIYGAYTAKVYDGVEVNIHGMTEYYPCAPTGGYGIWGGGTSYTKKDGTVVAGNISAATAGRPAVKLTVAPSVSEELTLHTPLHAAAQGACVVTGDVVTSVSGGIYPKGFAVEGKTVGEALASGAKISKYPSGTAVTYASGDSSVSGNVIVLSGSQTVSKSKEYYVRPNGSDSNTGLSFSMAKQTVYGAISQAVTDNGGSRVFPNGTKLTVYVDGTVNDGSGQSFMYDKPLTTADGSRVETVIKPYPATGSKATIVHSFTATASGAAVSYLGTDLLLKDVDVLTKEQTYQTLKVVAAGCSLTFDNANLITNNGKKWIVAADHFGRGGTDPTSGTEMYGTVTFKNGDYTNLDYVTTVNNNYIWISSGNTVVSIPNMHCKVIIEEGAKMASVYGPVGSMQVGSSVIEVRGGSVANLYGTGSGTKNIGIDTKLLVTGGTVGTLRGTGNGANVKLTGDIIIEVTGGTVDNFYGTGTSCTVTGDINSSVCGGTVNNFYGTNESANVTGTVTNTVSGGTVGGVRYAGVGKSATITGNVVNNVSGGKIEVRPVGASQEDGIFFGGYTSAVVTGNVTNTVTAGDVGVVYDEPSVDAGIYFGTHNKGNIGGNITNNISGGNFYTKTGKAATVGHAGIYMGMFIGRVGGDVANNISGGTFSVCKNDIYMGHRGVASSSNRIVNVFGTEGSTQGPNFASNVWINLGGGWGRLGNTTNVSTMPTENSDAVVISNTIYGGTFAGPVNAGPAASYTTNVVYVKGGIQNKIYGGNFGYFYCSGNAPVYGHVSTDIYGGTFNAIYGGRNGSIRDGAQLNIYAMTEGSDPSGIWVGAGSGDVSVTTANRDALKLIIAPESADKLVLSMPITLGANGAGTVTGSTAATVSGGTYTKGFAIEGKTLAEVLAPGYRCLEQSGKVMTLTSGQTATTDYTVVGKADLSTAGVMVTLDETVFTYDGAEKRPTMIVTLADKTLVEGTDYTVSYQRDGAATDDLASIGTITVVITGKGDLTGSTTTSYAIVRDPAVAKAIADLTEAVGKYDIDKVTSDDKAAITTHKADAAKLLSDHQAVLTQEEKDALNGLTETCDKLLERIASVADTVAQVEELMDGVRPDRATADDKALLTQTQALVSNLLAGSNLNTAERNKMSNYADAIADALARLEDVAAKQKQVTDALAGLTEDNVKSTDKTAVQAALDTANGLLGGENITAQERAAMTAAKEKAEKLLAKIQEVSNALDAVDLALKDLTVDNVKQDSAAAVAEAGDNAKILLASDNLTAQERAAMEAAKTKAEQLTARLDEVESKLESLDSFVDSMSAETMTSADKAAAQSALADAEDLLAGDNLTDAQRAEVQAAQQTLKQALQLLETVAAKQKEVTDALAGLTEENVKTTDKAAVQDALDIANALLSGKNLTAQERAAMTAAKEKAEKLLAKIGSVEKQLADAKALTEGLTKDNVTESHREDVEAAKEKAEALLAAPGNLTAEEKAAMEAVADNCEALLDRLNTMRTVDEKLDAAQKLMEDLTEASVTSDNKQDLEAAEKLLEEVAAVEELTDAQKARLEDLEKTNSKLLDRVEDAAELADPGEAGDIDDDNVTMADEDAVRQTLDQLKAALEDYENNYTEDELGALEDTIRQLERALAVIEEVQEAQKELMALPETAQPDDEAAIAAAEAARKTVDGLSERAKELLDKNALDRLENLEKALKDYKFTAGAGATWKETAGGSMEFTANGLLSKCTGILVDGKEVPADGYTLVSGSTIVTLQESYLKTLKAGKHNLTVVYSDGYAVCQFTVKTKTVTPDTGDNVLPGMLAGFMVLSVAGVAALVSVDRKRRSHR